MDTATNFFDVYEQMRLLQSFWNSQTYYPTTMCNPTQPLRMLSRTENPNNICQVCGRRFNRRGNLKRHLQLHRNTRPHACQECGKRFRSVDNLKSHLKVHLKPKFSRCQYCGKSYERAAFLERHEEQHRQDGDSKNPELVEMVKQELASFEHKRQRVTSLHNSIRAKKRRKTKTEKTEKENDVPADVQTHEDSNTTFSTGDFQKQQQQQQQQQFSQMFGYFAFRPHSLASQLPNLMNIQPPSPMSEDSSCASESPLQGNLFEDVNKIEEDEVGVDDEYNGDDDNQLFTRLVDPLSRSIHESDVMNFIGCNDF